MAAPLTPQLGATGIWKLREPFNTQLIDGVRYTCMGIRTLADIRADGKDPYAQYYAPHQLDRAIYDLDVKVNVSIVSLQPDSGQMVYVPTTYINSFPSVGGQPYRVLALAAHLEALPDNLDLSGCIIAIKNIIKDTLGVESTITQVQLSDVEMIDSATAQNLETARQLNIQNKTTDTSKLMAAQAQVAALQQQLGVLQQYIKDHLAP